LVEVFLTWSIAVSAAHAEAKAKVEIEQSSSRMRLARLILAPQKTVPAWSIDPSFLMLK
jgi:hypothetical protein